MRLRYWAFGLLTLVSAQTVSSQSFGFVVEAQWREPSGNVQAVVFAPTGDWFVAIAGHRVLAYDLGPQSGPPTLRNSFVAPAEVLGAAISPDGKTLAVVDRAGRLALLSAASFEPLAKIENAHKKEARTVTFSSDGSYLVTGGEDGRLRVWTARGQPFAELTQGARHKGPISLVAALPSARRVLSVGKDRKIILWDLDTQQALRPTQVELAVLDADLGGDGKTLVLGLQRLTGNRGRTAPITQLGSSGSPSAPPSTSESSLAHSIRADDRIRLIDAESGFLMRDFLGEQQDLNAVTVSPDGRFVAAAGSGSYASVWDATTGDRITNIPLEQPATAMAFSPNGKWLVTGTESGSIVLLKLSGVRPAAPSRKGHIVIIVLSPSGFTPERSTTAAIPRIATPSVRIQGKIKTPVPLKSLLVGGKEITSLVADDSGDVKFNAWVPLPAPGTHEVEIIAENLEGQIERQVLAIERTQQPSVPPPDGRAGRRIALIVGISDYADSSIDLEYADRDAKVLYDTLTNPALGPAAFDRRDVRLLVNKEATLAGINTGLRDFLRQAREEDSVLFYFAGHGAPDPNQLGDLYLLAHDTEPENIAGTGLLMRHVRETIAEIPAKHVLILTDACHSGGMASAPGLRSLKTNPIHQVFLDKLQHASGGLAILTASEAAQVSFENSRWDGHGVFTHFLVKGLRGAADEDRDNIVALGELLEYVREHVRRETSSKQIPAIGATSFDRDLPLAISNSTGNGRP